MKNGLALRQAAQLYLQAKKENKPFNPAQFGFVFSTADIELFIQACGPAQRTQTASTGRRADNKPRKIVRTNGNGLDKKVV